MAKRPCQLPHELEDAIQECDGSTLVALLEQHPDWSSATFTFRAADLSSANGKQISGGLLAAALRLCRFEVRALVEVLIAECGVAMDVPTSLVAGSSRLLWSGPPIHDAICTGNLEVVRYLLDSQADARASSIFGHGEGATALWQAAFNGFPSIVSLLLERGAHEDVETPSPWQDKPENLLTPLHVAARMGHAQVVEVLVDAGAQYDTRLLVQGGASPLRDAIQRCHVEVVKLLVQRDATVPRKALFDLNNEVTIAAVAEGLTLASKEAVKGCLLPVEWLGMFLRTPGQAPAQILNAIFQSHSLKYFDFEKQRQDANMAHFEGDEYLNVQEGIPYEEFHDYFIQRRQLGREGFELLQGLGVNVLKRQKWAEPLQDEVETYEWCDTRTVTGAQMAMKQFETNQRTSHRLRSQNTEVVQQKRGRCSCCRRSGAVLQVESLMSNRSFMAPARVLQCLLPDVLNNEYVLYAISHSSNEDIFEFHGCQAIVSLGWRQAWRSASLDSVFSVLLAILFATLTVSLGQQQPVSGVLLVAAGVLVTTNLIKQLLLMQGMFVLGKFRLYWATVQNYVDWCRIGLSYSVLGLSYAQWAAPSAELSVLLAVAVLFRWADVVTSFRGYQWVGEKVLPIERALMSSRMFAGIVWVACCAFTNAYIALRLSGSDRLFDSFFVIYRLGFLSDLEHSVWNGGSQDPQKDLAAALGIVTALIMTVVMMNIFIGVLSESYSQAYRNRHLSFQRERARIAFAHSVRNRAYDAWRSTCCCRRQKDAASSKYLWYSVKRTQAQGSHQHPPKQRSSSAGKSRRMSTLVRGLMLNKTMGSEDSGRRPRLPRQPSGGHSAHLPPPLAKPAFQAVVPAPPSQSEDEGDIPGMVLEDDVPVWEKIVSEGLDA